MESENASLKFIDIRRFELIVDLLGLLKSNDLRRSKSTSKSD